MSKPCNMSVAYSMKKRAKKMAKGGMIHAKDQYDPHNVPAPKHNGKASTESDRSLGQHGSDEQGPYEHCDTCEASPGNCYEHPVENQSEGPEDDMVGRIMKKMQQHFSEGGKVSNDDHMEDLADFDENDFDVMPEDDLEEHYTGANSGDHLGNEQEDHDREDIVSRIMKSRKKKDKLPNPR